MDCRRFPDDAAPAEHRRLVPRMTTQIASEKAEVGGAGALLAGRLPLLLASYHFGALPSDSLPEAGLGPVFFVSA